MATESGKHSIWTAHSQRQYSPTPTPPKKEIRNTSSLVLIKFIYTFGWFSPPIHTPKKTATRLEWFAWFDLSDLSDLSDCNAPVIWIPRGACPGESGPDNHLIFTSLCLVPGGRSEHSLSFLRSLIFRRLDVVRGKEWADDFKPSENQANSLTDERDSLTADSTQGTWVCTAEYHEVGTSLSIFAQVSGNFTGIRPHTEWMSPSCPGWVGASNDWNLPRLLTVTPGSASCSSLHGKTLRIHLPLGFNAFTMKFGFVRAWVRGLRGYM